MIFLLFTVLLTQMVMILLLMFKSPLRESLVIWLDGLKRGRAQLAVKSVAATVLVVMIYIIYSAVKTCSRSVDAVNSPDHAILAYRVLEASLLGFLLFLMLMIDRLHKYIREVTVLTDSINAARKQKQACEDSMKKNTDEAKSLKEKISMLRREMKKLESECDEKEKEVESRRASSGSLKDRLEGLVVEYDRLLADNKDLKDQLQEMNERLSQSSGKRRGFFSWDQWGL